MPHPEGTRQRGISLASQTRDSSLRLRPEFTLSGAEGLRMIKRKSLFEFGIRRIPPPN